MKNQKTLTGAEVVSGAFELHGSEKNRYFMIDNDTYAFNECNESELIDYAKDNLNFGHGNVNFIVKKLPTTTDVPTTLFFCGNGKIDSLTFMLMCESQIKKITYNE